MIASWWLLVWREGVVHSPWNWSRVMLIAWDLLIGNFDPFWVEISVDLAVDLEASIGRSGADQLHDHLMADQWIAAPVLGDEGEQATLVLVPLDGTRMATVLHLPQRFATTHWLTLNSCSASALTDAVGCG